jgi:hypothetical protein
VSHDTITVTHAEALARLADKPSLLKQAIARVVDGRLTTKQTGRLIEELTGSDVHRESRLGSLTNPDYLLQLLRYIYASLPHDDQTCPICYGKADYDDSEGKAQIFCKDCRWSLDVSLVVYGE